MNIMQMNINRCSVNVFISKGVQMFLSCPQLSKCYNHCVNHKLPKLMSANFCQERFVFLGSLCCQRMYSSTMKFKIGIQILWTTCRKLFWRTYLPSYFCLCKDPQSDLWVWNSLRFYLLGICHLKETGK